MKGKFTKMKRRIIILIAIIAIIFLSVTAITFVHKFSTEKQTTQEQTTGEGIQELSLVGTVSDNEWVKGWNLVESSILGISDDRVVITCMFSKELLDGESQYMQKIFSVDKDNQEIVKEITTDGNNMLIEGGKGIVKCSYYEDEKDNYIIYDYNLKEIHTFGCEFYKNAKITSDGERLYYEERNKIYVQMLKDGSVREIANNVPYRIEIVNDVLTDKEGKDYLFLRVMREDLNYYYAVMDCSMGEIIYNVSDEQLSNEINGDVLIRTIYDDSGISAWYITTDKNTIWEYYLNGNTNDIYYTVLDNGDVLFSHTNESGIVLELFDNINGNKKGILCVEGINMRGTPWYMDENNLLLPIYDGNDTLFYKWNISVASKENGVVETKKYIMNTYPSIDTVEKNEEFYVPMELGENLIPLREKADKLQEKYGVDIYIGEECGDIISGYSIAPLVDYSKLEEALEILDVELAKYPKGFFEQLLGKQYRKFNIYIAGELVNSEFGFVGISTGFVESEGDIINFALNCKGNHKIAPVIHHEIAHIIDERIEEYNNENESAIMVDEEWCKLNPFSDMYTYDYEVDVNENYYEFCYEHMLAVEKSLNDTYFVDTYSITYPTEDRARIFEHVMTTGENFDVDFDKAPNIKQKLNYYTECIRKAFDTSGWNDVIWEKYKD